jgi:hypothetical protein
MNKSTFNNLKASVLKEYSGAIKDDHDYYVSSSMKRGNENVIFRNAVSLLTDTKLEFIAHKLQTRKEMKSLLKPEELWKVRAYFVNATNQEGEWITDPVEDTSKASEVKVVSKAKPKAKAKAKSTSKASKTKLPPIGEGLPQSETEPKTEGFVTREEFVEFQAKTSSQLEQIIANTSK